MSQPPSARIRKNQAILRDLVQLHIKHPAMGLDMLHQMLRPIHGCGRERVRRLMKLGNIQSVRKKAYKCTTHSKHHSPIAPNLLCRNFSHALPNAAWVGDITYITTGEGWLYMAIVKDLCLKKVVGYAFSDRVDSRLTVDALEMAVKRQKPKKGCIFHSDRGIQYASNAFRNALARHGFVQSMSRKGDPYDNAVAENFFSCLKCECVHLQQFATRAQAKCEIFRYIEAFYNAIRPHSAIGWMAPNAYERCMFDSFFESA